MQRISMPSLIIFDLDDTLIGNSSTIGELWRRACRETDDGSLPDVEAVADRIILDGRHYWADPNRHREGRLDLVRIRRILCRQVLEESGINDVALADKIADRYSRLRDETSILLPGALEALESLRNRGIRLAMITNGSSEMQRDKLGRFRLEAYFERIVVEGEFGTGKPEPEGFLHVMKELGERPENTWMVGDDLERDIAPCRALGIFSVWVDGRGRGLPPDTRITPDRTIRSVAELPGLVE
jgi:putative hydrolase of the HAD superfamily